MSIKDTQINWLKEKVLQEKLQQGFFPSVALIESAMKDLFETQAAGTPRFQHREIVKGQVSSADDYNAMFNEIGVDLTVGFEEIKELNNQIMGLADYYGANRVRIDKELRAIEMKSAAIDMKANAPGNKDVVGDSLNDFLHIDFKGDERRNVPRTNAFVNLRFSEAELQRAKNRTIKHDLGAAAVRFRMEDPSLEIIHLTPLTNAVNDSMFESWRSIVVNKKAGNLIGIMDIDLPEAVEATCLSIDTQVGKPVYITLLTSVNGKDFVALERRKVVNTYQWVFERKTLQYLQLRIEKPEEDRSNGSDFEYLFGAKNLQLTDQSYAPESVLISKPFALTDHEAVQKLTLKATDYTPPGTSIRYYVGFDYDTNMLDWQEISEARPVFPDMTRPHQMEITRRTEGYGDLMYERYGQQYYRIAALKHRPLKKGVRLMIGRNMWLRETLPAPFTYNPVTDSSDAAVYQTGIHDWMRAGVGTKEYVRIYHRRDFLTANRFHRYTTHVFIEDPQSFRSLFKATDQASLSVYLNGSRVKSVSSEYSMSLRQGWNKVEVYAYARVPNEEIILDFYQPQMSEQIYAKREPLEQVSLYDMLNNTSIRMHNRFAVDEDNNLIVNYHPRLTDIQSRTGDDTEGARRMGEGIEYSLSYMYATTDQREHKLRLMAILSKEKEGVNATPRLKDYQIIVE